MGYCERVWVSPWTYNGLLKRMREEGVLASLPTNAPGVSSGPGPGAPAASPAPAAPAAADQRSDAPKREDPVVTGQGQLLTIIGRVNVEGGKGKIDDLVPVQRTFSKAYGEVVAGTAPVSVKLEYRDAKPVEYGCEVRQLTTEPNQEHDLNATVRCTFPQNPDMLRASLQVKRTPSTHAPRWPRDPTSSASPRLPRPGPARAVPQTDEVHMGRERRSETQSFIVQLSGDEGKTWETVGIGLKSPEILIPVERTKGLNRIQLKVFAVDGLRFDELKTETVVVPIANR